MVELKYFFTETKPIDGRIKYRYSDFVVEEIFKGRLCEAKRFVNDKKIEEKLEIPEKPKGREYLHMDLEKINRDLHDAIREIARFLHGGVKRIGYAGIKDKRAVTCQRISIFAPDTERLAKFRSKSLALRAPKWEKYAIDLGMLDANRFTVTIRDITLSKKELEKRLESFKEEFENKLLANYFGMQRFGGVRKISHKVGKAIVKKDFESAVMIFLSAVAPEEKEEVKNARTLVAQGEFVEALRIFPKEYRYERSILHHLVGHKNDYIGALRKLPRRILFLFTHAYQAYLFNKLINMRVEHNLGLKAIDDEPQQNGIALGLLPGYDSKFSPGIVGKLERELLKEEGITFEDFRIKELKECSSAGSRRKIAFKPKEFEILEVCNDDFFQGKTCCKIRFTLEKGCYATIVLRELLKKDVA